jgi:structural maintenance of chromosome 1
MRNQQAGQATFLPLDTLKVKLINDKFRSFAKGAQLAVDVIQFEPAVERAMHHACGNVLVCDTMEVAKFVTWEKGQEVKGWFGIRIMGIGTTNSLHSSGHVGGNHHP